MTAKFLDIFSKGGKKEIRKEKVIIDYREKNSLVISELVSLGLETEIKELKVADYIVGGVAVERKTISDFLSSMINKRLLKQLEELSQYPERILIIEGIDEHEIYSDDAEKGIHPNAIRGFLLSIILNHKIPILFTKNYKDTAKFLFILANKKPGEISLNISKKSLNKKEQVQFILEGFPGIGPKTSKKLLEKFKSIKNITNATEEELKKILGKRAPNIKKIIEEVY